MTLSKHDEGYEFTEHEQHPLFEFFYPREKSVKAVTVGLCDVRAADSIEISFDFDRDGWVIKQASTFEWPPGEKDFDSDWQEVAFIKAWARLKENV